MQGPHMVCWHAGSLGWCNWSKHYWILPLNHHQTTKKKIISNSYIKITAEVGVDANFPKLLFCTLNLWELHCFTKRQRVSKNNRYTWTVITASGKDPALPNFHTQLLDVSGFFIAKFCEVCKAQTSALHVNTEKIIPVNKVVSRRHSRW